MSLDILRAELERLFELEELLSLTRDVMGFDPEQVGGTSAKGSFALALTKLCLESDAVEALCDALLASKDHVNPAILQLRLSGPSDDRELQAGESLGAFTVVRKLGEGRLGASYLV